MSHSPALTAVTRPLADTFATWSLEELQTMPASVTVQGVT